MRLSRLHVLDFRSLKNETIDFPYPATVLVGPNNAGKSNILRAIQLVLGTDVGRMRDAITIRDFSSQDRTTDFRITALLRDLSTGDVDAFGVENLEPVDEHGELIPDAPDIAVVDENELALRIAVLGTYDEATEDYALTWWFAKHAEREVQVTRAQRQRVGFYFFRGGDSSVNWALGLSANSLIRRLLSQRGESLSQEAGEVNALLEGVHQILEGNTALTDVLDTVSQSMRRVLSLSGDPVRFGPGTRAGDDLLRGLELGAQFADSPLGLPFSAHGRGSVSAAALLTVLVYATEFQGSLILALEEPEVALHPHLQRLLFQELFARGAQVIVTTHSPVVVSASQPEQLILVKKSDKWTKTQPLIGETDRERTVAERELNRTLAEAVFSQGVFIVEGETDASFLQTIDTRLCEVDGCLALDAHGVSFVESNSCVAIPSVGDKLSILAVPRLGLADNDPSQPLQSVRDWGVNCELFFLWPRHQFAYDLEGVLCGFAPLVSVADAVSDVCEQVGEVRFVQLVASAAARVDDQTLRPWVVQQVQQGVQSLRDLVVAWQAETHGPSEESLREAVKVVIANRFKTRRHMRLLATAWPLDGLPPQMTDLIRTAHAYLRGEIGSCVVEFAI